MMEKRVDSRMTRILLTGAHGFIGSAIFQKLAQRDASVLALVRHGSKSLAPTPTLEYLDCDLAAMSPQVQERIRDFRPEIVIHVAWLGTENTDRNNPDFVWQNLNSSLALFKTCVDAGCRRFIGFGSQAEYSPSITADISENSPTFPESAYGVTKLATCAMLKELSLSQGVEFTWLRIFASYGKHYKPSYVMPYLIDCFRGKSMPLLKTPHAQWDYIHVDDVATAVMAVMDHPKAEGIYNLGTGHAHAVGDIALLLAELMQFPDIVALRKSIDMSQDTVTRRIADISKITKITGWKPAIDIMEGLKKCL